MLQQLRDTNGDMQLVVGNAGPMPELNLAPMVNGYVFECMNSNWNASLAPNWSPASWRTEFEAYRTMQANTRMPRINVLQGCGPYAKSGGVTGYSVPTPADLQNHRLTMGTALLSDGFYGYALHGSVSAPLWVDEYSVDSSGTAVEDRTKKGYLGQALSDAVELTDEGALLLQEEFESAVLPPSFFGSPSSVAITQSPEETITGVGSLVISNPDHTKQDYVLATTNPSIVPLVEGTTYLLVFDWRILETIDASAIVDVFGNLTMLDYSHLPGVVSGDSGTARFPVRIPAGGDWKFRIGIFNGGGKLAIDNLRIYQGGAGPWRRDFENGFVLVNPLSEARTFNSEELAGALRRKGIRRINGAQAPEINNGQAVEGELTLGPFDAIILLAEHVDAPGSAPAESHAVNWAQTARHFLY